MTEHMNERNVCIGDIIAVGDQAQLQVSLPRMPCFKLNHRFSIKNFAPQTYQTSRTGWYYRVVQEGTVRAGDEIRLLERKWPDWTIERIQEYLHRDKENLEMNAALAQVDSLGEESRGQFRRRVAKAENRDKPKKEDDVWRDYKVMKRHMETDRIVSITLQAANPVPEAADAVRMEGAHARIKLPNGLVRNYSVVAAEGCGNPRDEFELGIALDANSRGGSCYMHESVKVDDILQVGRLTTDVSPNGAASNHVFIVGGIGITAFLSLMRAMAGINWSVRLHYAVRSAADTPYVERLKELTDKDQESIKVYDAAQGQRMDVAAIVKEMPWNSHLYVCGPTRMMEAAREAVLEAGLPPNEVHYEAFAADVSGDPFEVEVAGKVLQVGEEESLLEVLQREFPDMASSCEVGNCGTCKVGLKNGDVEHRGTALLPDEQKNAMLACVSRGKRRIAIEI